MSADTFSQSKVKAFRRCRKIYDYKYNQGLTRRTAPATLSRGITLHEMLDASVMGKDWREPLECYRQEYQGLWSDETGNYSSPEDLESLYLRYQKHWANDGLNYRGRSEIEIETTHRGIKFKGIIDKLPEDQMGRVWLMDHKTHKILPDEDARFSDIQTVLYYWALREEGEKVDGVLWDYIRTKPPAIPETLKSGGLSKRANIDTDYDTYLAEIQRNGLNPADYQDILTKLKQGKKAFFLRVKLPTPNEALVSSVVNDFFDTAEQILEAKSFERNMTRDCKSCSYYQLCSAEVRGLDSEFVKKQLFTVRAD